jgi:4-carboxymuconolactone decarboxylase
MERSVIRDCREASMPPPDFAALHPGYARLFPPSTDANVAARRTLQHPKTIMARIAYIEENDHPELAELIGKIRAGRRGALINVYKLLLHTPALAAIWLDFVSAARFRTALDGRLREIVIVRVAHLNRTAYVFKQHVPQLSAPEGLSDAECDALADWRDAATFSPRERAALAYADAMTRDVAVPDAVFDGLRPHFDERQIVELSVLIGLYNMHTRVFTALGIDPEPHHR